MFPIRWLYWISMCLVSATAAAGDSVVAADSTPAALSHDYFPPPESRGGWRSLLPQTGEPGAELKSELRRQAGVDWDQLAEAWKYNSSAEGTSGLLVIRHGFIVGEWYKNCSREKSFNIYSCSKSYTSLAFGLLLADSEAGRLAGGKRLTLDTRVMTKDAESWPEAVSTRS